MAADTLPPDRLGGNTIVKRYEILKPLPNSVRMGEIAPGFGQPGGGVQYHFPGGIKELVKQGYLKEIQ
ncbi:MULTISPECIES: TNT domain-containing protein [unclassified Leifsonia]|uniref:TNT domain-containing protein n=1 Tax=unclassified Leifsonia TaxID=2663824 RepID=UPI00147C3936|nr:MULTISPECIES: TNT domain-containing protein [unclassified Leifsonia]